MPSTLVLFAVLNFVFSGLSLMASAFSVFVVVSSSIDPQFAQDEVVMIAFIYGFAAVLLFGMTLLYLAAGLGLLQRKPWGYYTHLAAAGLTTLNCACCCLGLAYTIPAFLFAFREDFQQAFNLSSLPAQETKQLS